MRYKQLKVIHWSKANESRVDLRLQRKPTKAELISVCIRSPKERVYRRNRRNCKEWQWISHSKLDNWKQYALMLIKEVKRIRRRFATCWSKLMNNCTVQLLIDAELSYFLKKQNKLKLFKQYSILRMRKVNIFCIEVRFVRSISYPFFRPWIFSAHLTRGLKNMQIPARECNFHLRSVGAKLISLY